MSPSTSSNAPRASRPGGTGTTHFRCPCGRSVVAPSDSDAVDTGRCTSCRRRARLEAPLHRSAPPAS